MNRAEALQAKWAALQADHKYAPGVTVQLREGSALLLDQAPGRGQWWAWSESLQAFALIQSPAKGREGWYYYCTGSGVPLDDLLQEVAA